MYVAMYSYRGSEDLSDRPVNSIRCLMVLKVSESFVCGHGMDGSGVIVIKKEEKVGWGGGAWWDVRPG